MSSMSCSEERGAHLESLLPRGLHTSICTTTGDCSTIVTPEHPARSQHELPGTAQCITGREQDRSHGSGCWDTTKNAKTQNLVIIYEIASQAVTAEAYRALMGFCLQAACSGPGSSMQHRGRGALRTIIPQLAALSGATSTDLVSCHAAA